jgi:hypothetical protein
VELALPQLLLAVALVGLLDSVPVVLLVFAERLTAPELLAFAVAEVLVALGQRVTLLVVLVALDLLRLICTHD